MPNFKKERTVWINEWNLILGIEIVCVSPK
jgi:hypothetical protein